MLDLLLAETLPIFSHGFYSYMSVTIQNTIYSVILLNDLGTNKMLTGSYWYLNVGTMEEYKTIRSKGVLEEHLFL